MNKKSEMKIEALPSVSSSEVLAALELYNQKHKHINGYYSLKLYSDGSGFLLDPIGERMMDKQFDTVHGALEILRSLTLRVSDGANNPNDFVLRKL